MYFLEKSFFETAVKTVKTIFFVNPAHLFRCRIQCRLWFIDQTWPESMIWPSNGRPKSKASMMTDDSMMTVWVRKGLIMENNRYHMYGTNSTLYNVAMKSFSLSSWNFIWTYPVFFAVKKCLYKNLIYLPVSTNKSSIKSENILCHVTSCTWV